MFHLSRLASHGFVVYAVDDDMVTPAMLTKGLDWLFAENEKSGGTLNQKLDLTQVKPLADPDLQGYRSEWLSLATA